MSNVKEIKRSPLTRIQQKYYDFIFAYVAVNKLFPTLREMVEGTGKSCVAPVQNALFCLERRGYIERTGDSNESRCYRLRSVFGLPSLTGAKAYKVTQSQNLLHKPVPSGAYLLQKDNKFIGCWIPSEVIESKGVKS